MKVIKNRFRLTMQKINILTGITQRNRIYTEKRIGVENYLFLPADENFLHSYIMLSKLGKNVNLCPMQ